MSSPDPSSAPVSAAEISALPAAVSVSAPASSAPSHDALTGLLSRSELIWRASDRALREDTTVLFLGLDRFRRVNERFGRDIGDRFLARTASRLATALHPGDLLGRLDGDEFAVVLFRQEPGAAERLARILLQEVRTPVELDGNTVALSASVGLAFSMPGVEFESLLQDADLALARAKSAGGDNLVWFDAQAHADLLDRSELADDLRDAIVHDRISLHFQPVYDSSGLVMVGAEALARWRHPSRGQVGPGVFVPLAEEAALADVLGELVLTHACEQARKWAHLPGFRVWVNVSASQLRAPGFADLILRHLSDAGVDPLRFGVELTEEALALAGDVDGELVLLSEEGVGIAVDDFGTGYSSLGRLNSLPIDLLKIDRSFVHQVLTPSGRAAVDAIVKLAHALGMRTVAEGVESPEELEAVLELGCDRVAGFLLGRPSPAGSMALTAAPLPPPRPSELPEPALATDLPEPATSSSLPEPAGL